MARLKDILEPGERVVMCSAAAMESPFDWAWGLLIGISPILYFAGFAYLQDSPGTWLKAVSVLCLFLWFVPLDVLLIAPLLNRWRVAVTDRRLLVRRWPFGLRRTEMRLAAVKDVRHEWRSKKVTLAGGGRAISIRCGECGAEELFEALLAARQGT